MRTKELVSDFERVNLRAAVLAYFDVDWFLDDSSKERADYLLDFLWKSCERVWDRDGTPRWRMRDRAREQIYRSFSRDALRAALLSVSELPLDPLQAIISGYLNDDLPRIDRCSVDHLASLITLSEWCGSIPGIPSIGELRAKLGLERLLSPLRLKAKLRSMRQVNALAAMEEFVFSNCPVIALSGEDGFGRSAILARLSLDLVKAGCVVAYLDLGQSWLLDGGPLTIVDEIVRQVALQVSEVPEELNSFQASAGRAIGSKSFPPEEDFLKVDSSNVSGEGLQREDSAPAGRVIVMFDTFEEIERRGELARFESVRSLLNEAMGVQILVAGPTNEVSEVVPATDRRGDNSPQNQDWVPGWIDGPDALAEALGMEGVISSGRGPTPPVQHAYWLQVMKAARAGQLPPSVNRKPEEPYVILGELDARTGPQ